MTTNGQREFHISDFADCPPEYQEVYIARACDQSLEWSRARRHEARHQLRWYIEVSVIVLVIFLAFAAFFWAVPLAIDGLEGNR